jgi:hypothetical protein
VEIFITEIKLSKYARFLNEKFCLQVERRVKKINNASYVKVTTKLPKEVKMVSERETLWGV